MDYGKPLFILASDPKTQPLASTQLNFAERGGSNRFTNIMGIRNTKGITLQAVSRYGWVPSPQCNAESL
jgi:hypothetical protein